MVLAATRRIPHTHADLAGGTWRGDYYSYDKVGPELEDSTVGLVGYGAIGSRVARMLAGFGAHVLVFDPYVTPEALAGRAEQVELDELLTRSKIVSLHARVTEETTGFLAAPQFRRMRRGAYFINTARGPMVNYDDLYEALRSGHLKGAMLETFWLEPPPAAAPLLKLETVTLTPHIAGASTTTVRSAARMIADEIRRYVAGEAPINPC
jgi:D-3-phosphoglycerate dehydrogenase